MNTIERRVALGIGLAGCKNKYHNRQAQGRKKYSKDLEPCTLCPLARHSL